MRAIRILIGIPLVIVAWLIEFAVCLLFWLPIRLIYGKNAFKALRSEMSLSEWLMVETDD
ncbi:hypothetical protein [uncultured Fibrella sp.]|uniref:hypothetical protein n=1 Tax=uncultured Fibrella sp. TaxID=1284596 RepID=UPI0035CB9340